MLATNPQDDSPVPAEGATSFSELGLSEALLRAIEETGYTSPTPIQAKAIPHILQGRDVLGCAQTGTGKTASFTLPMIEILSAARARARMPRSLIIAPTRELAAQVRQNFDTYGKYHKLTTVLLVGGESMLEQKKVLSRGVHVLIATPGRLIDLFERGSILLSDIRMVVLDECDRMLDMGFIPDIERIFSLLPTQRQTLMFSATVPPEIRRLVDQFLVMPKEVAVARQSTTAATVEQALIRVSERDKTKLLQSLLKAEDVRNALIFCNRKTTVAKVQKALDKAGFSVGCLHGDMSQPERTRTLQGFKADEIKLMVCSDVAARGLDIQGLSHVFNFDVPFHAEDYVHRIGRTGRAGKEGRAYTLATPDDGKFVADIQKLIGKDIPERDIDGFDAPPLEEDDGRSRSRRSRGGKGGKSAKTEKPDQGETPQKEKSSRSKRQPDAEAEMSREPAKPSKSPDKPARKKTKSRRDDDSDNAAVKGFGDDVPSFFKI